MLKSNFLIAFRNFRKHRFFSVINVLGLAIGISASLVIYLIVNYDFSFDKFQKDGDRIYRVVSDFKFSGQEYYNPGVPGPLANAVRNEARGISSIVPFHQPNFDIKVTVPSGLADNKATFKKQKEIIFADDNYFNLLSYQWIAGSAQTATKQPFQVVLSEKRARLYFPSLQTTDVVGKIITYNDSISATVAGIVKDLDKQTDFVFSEFISLSTIQNSGLKNLYQLDQWWGTDGTSQLFLKLAQDATVPQVEKQLAGIMKRYRKDQKQTVQDSYVFKLQPLSDLHFNSRYGIFAAWDGAVDVVAANKSVLYGLLIIGVFLLILGCVNFINLATAQAVQRAKEIGVRKTMGSSKKQLRWQFLTETFLITVAAAVLSVILVPFLLLVFEDFVPQGVHFSVMKYPGIVFFLASLILVVTFLSGFYPALVLSRYNPVVVLKSNHAGAIGATRKTWIRKTLTVSQFAVAQVFIMATLLVGKQIQYTFNKDLGFKKDAVVYFNASFYDSDERNKFLLIESLKNIPEISMVSLANNPPSSPNQRSGTWKYFDGKKEIETNVQIKFGDVNYIPLYKMKLLAGNNIAPTDTMNNVVINETYSRVMGFRNADEAVGKYVSWRDKKYSVVGVVADFHESSLHDQIKPLIINSRSSDELCINVLLQPKNGNATTWKTAIEKMGKVYKSIYPEGDFDYHFLDQSIASFYKKDQDISALLKWASGLAILISCLGLLGLVMYTTNVRTKEIGVRKILGASVLQIVSILSRDFIGLVIVAFAIATPVAWWGTHKWLENFSYKEGINLWLFLIAGLLMISIALLTLAFQTIRAAMANPVKSLRTE